MPQFDQSTIIHSELSRSTPLSLCFPSLSPNVSTPFGTSSLTLPITSVSTPFNTSSPTLPIPSVSTLFSTSNPTLPIPSVFTPHDTSSPTLPSPSVSTSHDTSNPTLTSSSVSTTHDASSPTLPSSCVSTLGIINPTPYNLDVLAPQESLPRASFNPTSIGFETTPSPLYREPLPQATMDMGLSTTGNHNTPHLSGLTHLKKGSWENMWEMSKATSSTTLGC